MDVIGGRRRGPVPLVVTGPLATFESLVCTELVSRGYAASSVRDAVRMMRRLSLWMDRRELVAAGLTPSRVEEFLAFRRAVCSSEPVARRSLGAVVKVLRHAGGWRPVEDTVGEFSWRYTGRIRVNREVLVVARGVSVSQASVRMRLRAAAVRTCWKPVLSSPR